MFSPLFKIQSFRQMSRQMIFLAALVLIAAAFLSACGTQATPAAVLPANTDAPAAAGTAAATSAPAASAISFSKDVMPILQSRCVNCHGGQQTQKGLDLTSYDKLMTGSENGAVVTAGDANNSLLIQLINQGKMPKRGPKLLPEQVQVLIDWINGGALNN